MWVLDPHSHEDLELCRPGLEDTLMDAPGQGCRKAPAPSQLAGNMQSVSSEKLTVPLS